MTKNMNNLDRGLRALVVAPAAVVAALLVGAGSIGGIVLFALAAVMLATSAVGFCPIYALLHIKTSGRTPLPYGIYAQGASGNLFEANQMFGNGVFDARDEARESNTWIANQCQTDFPAGTICGVG